MSMLKKVRYVVKGTDAQGNPIRTEERQYTKAKQLAALMVRWTGNPAVVERHEYVDGTWQFKEEVL